MGRCSAQGGPITGTWGSVNICYGSMQDDAGGFWQRTSRWWRTKIISSSGMSAYHADTGIPGMPTLTTNIYYLSPSHLALHPSAYIV